MLDLTDIKKLKNALDKLEYQLENHQQDKSVEVNLAEIIANFKQNLDFNLFNGIDEKLKLIQAAICDEKGLGRLNLLLANAKVPKKYYDIFYNMLRGGVDKLVCVDCGAHAGLISDIMLHCEAFVYAFEPNLHLQKFLRRKYKNNDNIKLYQKAVATFNGTTDFLIFEKRNLSQGNRILKSKQDKNTSKSYKVEVVDICEFIEKEILKEVDKIYFLKLDIEGAEFEILEKLIERKLYKNIEFIAVETHEYMFEDGNKKLQNIKSLIEKFKISNILLDWC